MKRRILWSTALLAALWLAACGRIAPSANPIAPTAAAETVRDVLRTLAATDRVVAVSVSLWEPALDPDGQTQAVVQGALNALLGR